MDVTNQKRIAFLCSGGGGNLCFIYEAIQRDWIAGAAIVAVLTDRLCQANRFASLNGIPNKCVDFGGNGQQYLLNELDGIEPDLIVTTVHKVLSRPVVEKYRGKLINLHYSLLPSFGGLIGVQSVKAAMSYGAKFTGVTVHLVDENVDGGTPIVQAAIPLHISDRDAHGVMNLVFRCGCMSLLSAINQRLTGTLVDSTEYVEMMGRTCSFSGGSIPPLLSQAGEDFWGGIAETNRIV